MTPSKPLQTLVAKIIGSYPDATALTLNFRDPDYSPELGGYRPVEIRLEKRAGSWPTSPSSLTSVASWSRISILTSTPGWPHSSGVESGRWPPPWTSTGSGRGTFSTITGWRSTD